jgi:hypothetical protein
LYLRILCFSSSHGKRLDQLANTLTNPFCSMSR